MHQTVKGDLYLVPATLGNKETKHTIPAGISEIVASVQVFIVENLRSARRFLKLLDPSIDIDRLTFYELNEHTPPEVIPSFLEPCTNGSDTAVISEAGVPAVADPGSSVVRLAHERGIRVVPLTGPSSILLALMASGLNGQQFTFHGYLPVKRKERIRMIREVEEISRKTGATQLFMEAPYRNDGLLEDLMATCNRSTLLCIAADITLESEMIRTHPIGQWKRNPPTLHKRPVIFLLGV
jgi:16S rRNA (cytidine1402-2'-O)-methyltransferase